MWQQALSWLQNIPVIVACCPLSRAMMIHKQLIAFQYSMLMVESSCEGLVVTISSQSPREVVGILMMGVQRAYPLVWCGVAPCMEFLAICV